MTIYYLVTLVLCFTSSECGFFDDVFNFNDDKPVFVSEEKLYEMSNSTKYVIYSGSNLNGTSYGSDELCKLVKNADFQENRLTVIYIHGYHESCESESVLTIRDAYLTKDVNFVVLDWSQAASANYPQVVVNQAALSKPLGNCLADAIEEGCLKKEKTHIVGHSAGAHLGGAMGTVCIEKDQKLPRITGLDAAGPLQYGLLNKILDTCHLTYTCADVVDGLITDQGFYGRACNKYRVNIYVNGGCRRQPECPCVIPFSRGPKDICSHQFSWKVWAYAVKGEGAPILAVKEDSWSGFLKSDCKPDDIITVGPDMNLSAEGDYFVETNAGPSYGRGKAGARC